MRISIAPLRRLIHPWTIPGTILLLYGLLQLRLSSQGSSPTDSRLPRFSTIDASFESLRPLTVPITIVTAASANHACALEAFLYDLNATLSLLSTSPLEDKRLWEDRLDRGRHYIETSPDLMAIRPRPQRNKKKQSQLLSSLDPALESRQDSPILEERVRFEVRPRIVVYNMGMGPGKRKKRRLRALIEAGYMDEVVDFDFEQYPAFWALGTETRGEYGWKAGIIEEVSRALLANRQPRKHDKQDQGKDEDQKKEQETTHDSKNEDEDEKEGMNKDETPSSEPGLVLWLDAGDRVSVGFLRWLPGYLAQHGLWTPQSQDTFQTWTHPGLLAFYHDAFDRFPPEESNCNGAVMAWDVSNATVRNGILQEWIHCAKTQECIAPLGSSRENHRQDQAALTYLVKTMGYGPHLCHGFPEHFGVQVNQDRFCKQDLAAYPYRVFSD